MQNRTFVISRTDSIGDVMLTLPLTGLLKKKFPGCRIIFIGRRYTRAVVACCEYVDEFADWDEISAKDKGEQENVFRRFKADAILHVFPQREIASLAKRAGIPARIGTSHRLFHWWTCNRKVDFSRKNSELHEAQLNCKLLGPLGIKGDFPLGELADNYGFTRAKALPEKFSALIDKNKFNLILHPRSKGSAREWGLDNFSKLIERLPKDKAEVFVSGTKEEGETLRSLLEKHPGINDLTGKLSLEEFISFINACDGLVAASTGPLHIAAALGKKAVGLYAPMRPIHPGRWAPLGKSAGYLVLDKTCSDCKHNADCHCIREISAFAVLEKLGL
ncbi:MAG TPA: glycosyltransferase family 9 protein [Bacteroidia bacterium]|jgi:ADP-heptose:LPS heptosyltransferase